MRRSFGLIPGLVIATSVACSGGGGAGSGTGQTPGGATPAGSASSPPSSAASSVAPVSAQKMIVVLRDQLPGATDRASLSARSASIAAAHAPFIAQLQAKRARSVHSFQLVNAFATTLDPSEADALSARSDVLSVVPDRQVTLPRRRPRPQAAHGSTTPARTGSSAQLCNTLEPEALQLMNVAFLDPTTPQAQEIRDGNGELVTGRGVTVGIVADGLDTTIPGFTHSDGTPVFVDYQDFSGDPAGTPTAGGEMFGDASSIAAQDTPSGQVLQYDISTFGNVGHPLPSPCDVRVRGVAPGSSLVGLKVFSDLGYSFYSAIIQAIDYAVFHDHVDVLNESLGIYGFPDLTQDPLSLANEAAVQAGIPVVVATGDAGTAGTLGSPATDPFVIAAGATTQFRFYAQLSLSGAELSNGWIDNNIAGFSSAGFAQATPRTVDLVAPGDSGWALCSTNSTLYTDCTNLEGNPTPVEWFGGTSEATPLTSGTAALIIQAYRSTHGGQSPSPALVKSILMSSATDIGAPSSEQGAGLVNALKAVQTALSAPGARGRAAPIGDGFLVTPSTASFTAQPGQRLSSTFTVTNAGAEPLALAPTLDTLGPAIAGQTRNIDYESAGLPTYVAGTGNAVSYSPQTFTVPAGADHLDVAIAFPPTYQGSQTYASLVVLDPSGREAASAYLQGNGSGYAHVDVVKPTAGVWTTEIIGIEAVTSTSLIPFSGPVQLTWSAENYVRAGAVSPPSVFLEPGQSASLYASLDAPAEPGDLAAAVRFGNASTSEMPFTVRTLIPLAPSGGRFTGTLTGGNARAGGYPTSTYEFELPSNAGDLAVNLNVPAGGYGLDAFLIDPNGEMLGSSSNFDIYGAQQNAVSIVHAAPAAGLWRLIVEEWQASGAATSLALNGQITLGGEGASASGLPTSAGATISASAGLAVDVQVTNTDSIAKAFFVDARLDSYADVSLPLAIYSSTTGSPDTSFTLSDYAILPVPPGVRALLVTGQSAGPLSLFVSPYWGDPEQMAQPAGGGSLVASFAAPELEFGWWYISPGGVGPYGAAGVASQAVTATAVATMHPFDTAVTAVSGNEWADSINGTFTYAPLILEPGASGIIPVTIKPDPTTVGAIVRGTLSIDAYDGYSDPEEAFHLPYEYKVAP